MGIRAELKEELLTSFDKLSPVKQEVIMSFLRFTLAEEEVKKLTESFCQGETNLYTNDNNISNVTNVVPFRCKNH